MFAFLIRADHDGVGVEPAWRAQLRPQKERAARNRRSLSAPTGLAKKNDEIQNQRISPPSLATKECADKQPDTRSQDETIRVICRNFSRVISGPVRYRRLNIFTAVAVMPRWRRETPSGDADAHDIAK